MSNGDEIVDSWEEIDEVELSTQLGQLKKELISEEEDNKTDTTMPFHHQNGVPLMMVMRPDEEYGANYTQSNKSTVKILRRPIQQNNNDVKQNETRPKQPIKTLQQREQEYAEARLRILGSAKNPEDELESNLSTSKIVMKSPPLPPLSSSSSSTDFSTFNYNNYQGRNVNSNINNYSIGNLAAGTCNDIFTTASSPIPFFNYNNVNISQIKSQENMIIRMPRGPDGTSGFSFRR